MEKRRVGPAIIKDRAHRGAQLAVDSAPARRALELT